MSTTTAALPQPVTPVLPQEQVQREFFLAQCTDVPDPLWHFEFAVRKTVRYEPGDKTVPGPDRCQLLGRFFNADPQYAIEVFGQNWDYEIDAADFLDAWLEQRGKHAKMTVVSRAPQPNAGGHVGDVVTTGGEGDAAWAARLICFKFGPRILLLSFRCALSDYERLADEFFVSIMTTRMLDESPGVLAEKVRYIRATQPLEWKVAVPLSCDVKPGPQGLSIGEFEAEVVTETDAGRQPMGRLTFTLVDPARMRDERDAISKILKAFRNAGLTVPLADPVPEPFNPPYLGSWTAEVPVRLPNGKDGELRIRIQHHPKAWVLAAVVGVTRELSVGIWMRNKRLLDVVRMTLEIV